MACPALYGIARPQAFRALVLTNTCAPRKKVAAPKVPKPEEAPKPDKEKEKEPEPKHDAEAKFFDRSWDV